MQTPALTTKQTDIILLLYRFRFLDRLDIQTYFHHKTPRRINSWLKELSEQQYIGRIYSRGFKENVKPAIYYLNTKSRLFLKNQKGIDNNLIDRIYREKLRSRGFITHCQIAAKIYFNLLSLAENSHAKLNFYTKTDLSIFDNLIDPLPDAYIAIEEKDFTKRYFLEIFDESNPRFVIRRRIQQYFKYYENREWQDKAKKTFPKIIMICPDDKLIKSIRYFIQKELNDEPELEFYISTHVIILTKGINREALEKVEPKNE
jgi:hypothetical protein